MLFRPPPSGLRRRFRIGVDGNQRVDAGDSEHFSDHGLRARQHHVPSPQGERLGVGNSVRIPMEARNDTWDKSTTISAGRVAVRPVKRRSICSVPALSMRPDRAIFWTPSASVRLSAPCWNMREAAGAGRGHSHGRECGDPVILS